MGPREVDRLFRRGKLDRWAHSLVGERRHCAELRVQLRGHDRLCIALDEPSPPVGAMIDVGVYEANRDVRSAESDARGCGRARGVTQWNPVGRALGLDSSL